MSKLKNLSVLFLMVTGFVFTTACAEDATMDDVMNNTEINSPAPSHGGDGDDSDEDKPSGN